jgi:hypothetical protein
MAMSSTSCCSGLLAKRSAAFAPSPIQQLSLLAQRCNAINLAEGHARTPSPRRYPMFFGIIQSITLSISYAQVFLIFQLHWKSRRLP